MNNWATWHSRAPLPGLSSTGSSVVDSEVTARPSAPSQYYLQGDLGTNAPSQKLGDDANSQLSVQQPVAQNPPLSQRDEDEVQQQREREIARKQQTALRRGLFSARELCDWQSEEFPLLDKVCVVRFPPEVAATLRQRLINATNSTNAEDGTPQGGSGDLGLSIVPRPDFNHRLFDVRVSGYRGRLRGVLVELPALVEAYKCIDGDLLYKSGDISQMLYVYESTCDSLDLRRLCDQQQWEWLGGLTPPTHRIRSRKFRNLDLFDRHEIRDAELEALQMLHSLRRDFFELHVHSELHMIEEQAALQQQRQQEKQGDRQTPTKGDRLERVVGASEDIDRLLELVREDDSAASDASDVLFSEDALQQQQMTLLQRQLGRQPGTGGRMSDVGKARRRGGTAGSSISAEGTSTTLAFGGAPDFDHPPISEAQQQLLLLQGLGVPAPTEALAFGEAAEDPLAREERRRLRRERRKQKKAQKKAKKEMRMQQQQQQQRLDNGSSSAQHGLNNENKDNATALSLQTSGDSTSAQNLSGSHGVQNSSSRHGEAKGLAQFSMEDDGLSSADSGDDF